jgi:hypothetical protein
LLLEQLERSANESEPSMPELSAERGELLMRGIASAVRHKGTLTDTQTGVLGSVGKYLLGVEIAPGDLEPLGPHEFADAVTDEDLRLRAVHGMLVLEILANPVPAEVTAQVEQYSKALHVDEEMLIVARDYSKGAMDVAMGDLIRNSYVAEYHAREDGNKPLPKSGAATNSDPELAAKWEALESCPEGSHGRIVWEFYQARGFTFPGIPGAVDSLLAQHDWVHCLADYGTSATGEIEVFTFLASAIPDPKGFSYAVIIIGLFETGYISAVPGVATANPGHLSLPGGPTRLADSLRRGLAMNLDVMGGVDWFQYANDPIDDVRRKLGVLPKGTDALAAGSLSAMDPNAVFSRSV